MSNFKKVILFVSMIAVLVSSLMLPTFADESDYPLTDPYREGYSGKVFSVGVNMNNVPTATVVEYIGVPPSTPMKSFTVCIHTVNNIYTYTPDDGNSVKGYSVVAYSSGSINISIVSLNTSNLSVSWDYNTGVARVTFPWSDYEHSIDDNVISVSVRFYGDYSQLSFQNNTMNNRPESTFYQYTIIETVDYNEREYVFNNGITEGIQQGYQNGYDEGYVEGFASAGGVFADVVSNPQVGLGVPDIRVQFPVFPSDNLTLGSSALTNNLMKFAHVSAVGDSLYEGNGIDVYGSVSEMRWLGTLNSDPKKNGWVCTLWNEAQTAILGTLHWDSARDWEWYEGASAIEIELISPDDILTNIRLDIWVHGDSTAFIDTAVLNDNGFAITYPFMGEVFYEDGYHNGYDNGLEDGFNGADTSQAWMNLKDTIFVIFDAPFYVISQSLNFELFGINIAGAIISIISVALIVFILKIIIVRLF